MNRMRCEYITREQLRASTHEEINDSVILGMCGDIAFTTTHTIIVTWLIHRLGFATDELIENFAKKLLRTGRISPEMRKFVIDIMCGDRVLYLDYKGRTAAFVA
jgi:hypothetical protein